MRLEFAMILVALISILSLAANGEEQYGTGLSLSSDYGTVSLYFTNGGLVDVAKIEGNEEYKAFMLDERDTQDPTPIATAIHCPLPKRLCRYWPIKRWSSSKIPNPLTPMLSALVHAVETTLETDIRSAMISAHGLQGLGTACTHIQSALIGMDIQSWNSPWRVIRHVMSAPHLEGPCNDPDDPGDDLSRRQHILVIKYTRSLMTAVIWGEECRDYWRVSRVNSPESGHDNIAACKDSAEDSESCNAVLQAAFGKLVERSLSHTRKPGLGAVLVFGENADDENLLHVLRKALKDDFVTGASNKVVKVQDFSPDLAFAGSRVAAMFELRQKDWIRKLIEEENSRHDEL
ncbi:hypothetical protein MBLNU13_g10931t1 [Cladosporium sp. NU13]